MSRTILALCLLSALAVPAVAAAQDRRDCIRDNRATSNEGAALGAVGGAVVGNQLAGRGSRTEGTILGAIGGAIVGNALAGTQNQPCPDGYSYGPERQGDGYYTTPAPVYATPDNGYRYAPERQDDGDYAQPAPVYSRPDNAYPAPAPDYSQSYQRPTDRSYDQPRGDGY